MGKSVAMKDIAEAMGLSIVSVSNALAGRDGVSEEMRNRVQQKATELGYSYKKEKNNIQMHGNIGVLVADRFFSDCAFYTTMYRSVIMKCADIGATGILEIVDENAELTCEVPKLILDKKIDGIILMGELSSQYVNMIVQSGVPYILLDFYDDTHSGDSIVSDGIFGTYQLTCHLIHRGHKNIYFVGNRLATSSIMDRFLGYYKALLNHGIEFREELVISDRDELGRYIDLELPKEMPSAFVCNCDEIAKVLVEKLSANGYNVPNDVSVVGFDDFRFATLCQPPLTSFHVDVDEMANLAIARITRKIKGKNYTEGRMIVNGYVVVRDSVAVYHAK